MSSLKEPLRNDVFIPKIARILTITHLCLVFAYLSWFFIGPYFSAHFEHRIESSLCLSLMGKSELPIESEGNEALRKNILKRNLQRFTQLSLQEREWISNQYKKLSQENGAEKISFIQNIKTFFTLPNTLIAWLILSVIIGIFILIRIEGAVLSSWLLMLLAISYSFHNYYSAQTLPPIAEYSLYPHEKELVDSYLVETLSDDIQEQRVQLKKAWKRYLVRRWTDKKFEKDPSPLLIEEASYAFELARLHLIIEAKERPSLSDWRHTSLSLLLFSLWNILLASYLNKRLQ